jgi:hypothetical protein
MITPTDYISDFAYGRYVRPALERGDKTVTIDTREIYDGLGGAYSENFVGTVLGSLHFRETCCVALVSAELAATETYTFRLDISRKVLR